MWYESVCFLWIIKTDSSWRCTKWGMYLMSLRTSFFVFWEKKWFLLVLFANWKVFRCRHPLFKYRKLQVEHQLLIIYIFKRFWTTYQSLPKNKKIKISAEYPENLCHFTEQKGYFCKNTQPTTNYLSNFWILFRIISFG